MKQLIRTSVVILNWNGKSFLEKFLPSVIRYTSLPHVEIVVADNGSTDDSIELLHQSFPQVRIIQLDRNYGFAEGYNKALEQINSQYTVLLNSDIEVTEGWLDALEDCMELNPEVGACSPKLLDYNKRTHFEYAGAAGGFIDRYGYTLCRGRIFGEVEEDLGQYDDECDVFWGTGACLMVRTELYRKAGGLDGRFFCHMEEIDLCWRLKNMGFRIVYIPRSTVYHVGGGALAYGNPQKTFLNYRNNLMMLLKNLPGVSAFYTLLFRMDMDGLSATRSLVKGDFRDFWAIIRAHFAFYASIPHYLVYRRLTKKTIPRRHHPEMLQQSIVLEHFIGRKKTFADLIR